MHEGMTRMVRFITFLLFILTGPAFAAGVADIRYQELLAQARAGQSVDWQELRFAYADSSDFDLSGTKTAEARKAMGEALKAEDFAGALAKANLIIEQEFIDVDAHFVSEMANSKLGNADEAKKQHAIVLGLLRSIHTGDGKTAEDALTVIAVREEYSFIRAIGLRRVRQALVAKGGHHYDVLDVVDRNGQPQTIYFLVDRVLAAENDMLKSGR